MTSDATPAFAPVDIPDGQQPRWERRYPGRFQFELNAFQRAGITPAPDFEALRIGSLVLTFEWPLDAKTTLRLRAVYPDAFPHIRPQVYLLGGLATPLVRHLNPTDGNLCLLGRDTRQWVPSWTLYKFLSKQLADAIQGTGEEDPQGEPADIWWNSLGSAGTYCLIDSRWDLGEAYEGSLTLRLVHAGTQKRISDGKMTKVPIIRAVVSQVRDAQNKVLHDWEGPFPSEFAAGAKTLRFPWVRLKETTYPEPNVGKQFDAFIDAFPRLQNIKPGNISPNLTVMLFAVAHPTEIEFGRIGIGWVFFLLFGHPNVFKARTKGRRKNPSPTLTLLPALRAGPDDIGHRVPAVRTLRDKRILVVGTGAVGAPAAVELARNRCGTLHLLDHDVVEPGNTIRWPLGASAWGTPKLEALKGFLNREYPATEVETHPHCLGQAGIRAQDLPGDDAILDAILPEVDLVLDGSASHGVTTLLAERCREARVPLISLFATPTLEGGAVVLHGAEGGCPNCLEYAWERGEIAPPPGRDNDDALTQPPGCAERTFVGAGYDLQELSLQAVRLTVETLSGDQPLASLIQTLGYVDEEGRRCPPRWRVDPLPKHPDCKCRK